MPDRRRVSTRSVLGRSILVALLSAALAAALVGSPSAGAPLVAPRQAAPDSDPRPNIVLVMTDDMALTDLSAMPAVTAQLGASGTTFSRAVAPFSLCCPNRVSMLTGQYAHNHGVLGNDAGNYPLGGYRNFTTDDNTVATWLHDAGYQTGFVGKYLNGYGTEAAPARVPPGWDEWHGGRGSNYGWTKMYEDGIDTIYQDPVYIPHKLTSIAKDLIARRVPAGGPLFLWLSYNTPHNGPPDDPDDCINTAGRAITSPSPALMDRDKFATAPFPTSPSYDEADVSDKPAAIRALPRISAVVTGCLAEVHRQRLESLQSVNRGVGGMVTAMRDAGELANTVFVFTSDNGYLLGHHRVQQGKVLPYEESIRVPLVIRGPGFPAGVTRNQLVASPDLAPTFVDLADATAARTVDGVSLQPLANDPALRAGRDIVLEAGPNTVGGPMQFTGLRTGGYMYAEYATGERELYDLAQDPNQLRNVAGVAGYATIQTTLRNQLATMRSCSGTACRNSTPH